MHRQARHRQAPAISVLLLLTCCGADTGPSGLEQCSDTEDYSYVEPQAYAELCAPNFDLCNPCPSEGLCLAGTVDGNALSGGTVDNFGPDNAICTRVCDNDSDCTSLDFVGENGYAETTEQWRCADIGDRKVCAVSVASQGGSEGGCDEACLDTCTVGESCLDICCD